METEQGPGLFLFISTLTGTRTMSTYGTDHFVLLHAVTVLFLCACSLLSGLVHTILSILQHDPCPAAAPVLGPPNPAAITDAGTRMSAITAQIKILLSMVFPPCGCRQADYY